MDDNRFFVVYNPVPSQLAHPIMAYLSMFGKKSACLKISANATSSGCSLIIFPSFPPSPHPHLSPSGQRRGGSALVASPPERLGLRRSHAELCAVPWRGATLGAAAHSTLDTKHVTKTLKNKLKMDQSGWVWFSTENRWTSLSIDINWMVGRWFDYIVSLCKFGYWRCMGWILVCFGTKEQLYLSNCPRREIVHPGCNPIPLILNPPPYGPPNEDI
jgi:hypothetical protein